MHHREPHIGTTDGQIHPALVRRLPHTRNQPAGLLSGLAEVGESRPELRRYIQLHIHLPPCDLVQRRTGAHPLATCGMRVQQTKRPRAPEKEHSAQDGRSRSCQRLRTGRRSGGPRCAGYASAPRHGPSTGVFSNERFLIHRQRHQVFPSQVPARRNIGNRAWNASVSDISVTALPCGRAWWSDDERGIGRGR